MELHNRVAIVTGAARGIGRAVASELLAAGTRVVISDFDIAAGRQTATELGTEFFACDVSSLEQTRQLVEYAETHLGPVDIFVANAGITVKGGVETTVEDWQWLWDVNVMSRVHAARTVIPGMIERGGGCFIQVASAAALLTEVGSAAYSVTKHADLAFAEWLAIRYGREGLQVGCVCPLGVATEMLDETDPVHQFLQVSAITAEAAATAVIQGIRQQTFLILPHPEVAEFMQMKADDPRRWLKGMQRLQQKWRRQQMRSETKRPHISASASAIDSVVNVTEQTADANETP